MFIIIFFLSLFITLVIVGIWYDRIIPPINSTLTKLSSKRVQKNRYSTDKTSKIRAIDVIKNSDGYEKIESWLKGRTKNILFGIFMIAFSLYIRSGEGEYYYRWGNPIARSIWIIWFSGGVVFFVFGILRKDKSSPSPYVFICTNCYKLYKATDIIENECLVCNGLIQGVKEFYKQHPNFYKEENITRKLKGQPGHSGFE